MIVTTESNLGKEDETSPSIVYLGMDREIFFILIAAVGGTCLILLTFVVVCSVKKHNSLKRQIHSLEKTKSHSLDIEYALPTTPHNQDEGGNDIDDEDDVGMKTEGMNDTTNENVIRLVQSNGNEKDDDELYIPGNVMRVVTPDETPMDDGLYGPNPLQTKK